MATMRFMEFGITTYFSADGKFVISREYGIHPESNMPMQGNWVLRNRATGEFVDSDIYSNDIAERNDIQLIPAGK